ncbi:MAG: hypothetical protein ACQESC_00965 [Nanobdellota archaeon]
MTIDLEKYQDKGWSEEEIAHAKTILNDAEQNKHKHMKHLEKAIYWMLLIITAGFTIGISYVILPIISLMKTEGAIVVTIITGLLIGILLTILIKDVEQLQGHHHVLIVLVLPISALLSGTVLTKHMGGSLNLIQGTAHHNPYVLGMLLGISIILPYIIKQAYKRMKNHEIN